MDKESLLALAVSRRCWLKLLETIDAPERLPWDGEDGVVCIRFDSRPIDVRKGQLVYCVHPQRAVIFAVAEFRENGATALHDFEASATRWLFKVPVRVLTVVHDLSRAPHARVAGGPAARFSYRPLTRRQAENIAVELVAAL